MCLMRQTLGLLFWGLLISCNQIETNEEAKTNINESTSHNLLGGTNEKLGEMLIRDEYWVEVYIDTSDSSFRALLTNSKNTEKKVIIDTLVLGLLEEDEWVDYGTVQKYGKVDPELVVVYAIDSNTLQANILEAWKASLLMQQFQSVPTDGIQLERYD